MKLSKYALSSIWGRYTVDGPLSSPFFAEAVFGALFFDKRSGLVDLGCYSAQSTPDAPYCYVLFI